MQFEKPKKLLRLTHSEASWLAHSTGGLNVPDAIRMRAEQSRRDAVQDVLPPDTFVGVPHLPGRVKNPDTWERTIAAQEVLIAAEQTLGVTPDGQELHTATMDASVEEVVVIYNAAVGAKAVAEEAVSNFREHVNRLADDSPPENRLNESDQVNFEGWQTDVYFKDIQVTSGIIDGLSPHVHTT